MIGARKVGWRQAIHDLRVFARDTKRSVQRAVAQEAHHWAAEIKKGIRTQSSAGKARPPWAPLAQSTIDRKRGSTKILIDTGVLLRSIGPEKISDWSWFSGVKRGSKTADGEDLVNIAAVHEYGYSIKSGRSGGEVIVMPKRSFVEPVYDELSKDIKARVFDRYAKDVQKGMLKKNLARGI